MRMLLRGEGLRIEMRIFVTEIGYHNLEAFMGDMSFHLQFISTNYLRDLIKLLNFPNVHNTSHKSFQPFLKKQISSVQFYLMRQTNDL